MSKASGTERYNPQHPLPEEIKKMSRDETVCHFCGVSYLIHSEMKRLEDRLKETEKQLENYKGAVEREKLLIIELDELKSLKGDLENTLQSKESEISSFNLNLKCQRELTEQLRKEKSEVIEERDEYKKQSLQYSQVIQQLPSILKKVHNFKSDINNVHKLIKSQEIEIKEDVQTMLNKFTSLYSQQNQDHDKLLAQIEVLEIEKKMMNQSTTALNNQLKSTELEINNYKKLQTDYNDLNLKYQALQHSVKKYKEEIVTLKTDNSKYLSEVQVYKEDLKKQSGNLNAITQQNEIKEKQTLEIVKRLQNDVKEKENNLIKVHDDLKKLEYKFHEQQRKELETSEKSALHQNEILQLKNQLSKLKEELEKLKAEREEMISTHQNRIEDLRAKYQHKSSELDLWSEKMDEAVKNERMKNENNLKLLEDKLKENFIMELQIEKEKYKELMCKYQSVNKDKESKWKEEMNKIESSYKSEYNQLKQSLLDNKQCSVEKEGELNREIDSLKDIIKDLENRLGKLDTGNAQDISQLKSQLRQTKSELQDALSDMNKMAENLKNSKQEIQFLQDTVRKECEERFELTEALSEARQELLRLKKPLGGYSSASSRRSLTTPPKTSGSLSSIISDIEGDNHSLKSDLNTNINKPPSSGKSSVSQNRRRIANILGKKS